MFECDRVFSFFENIFAWNGAVLNFTTLHPFFVYHSHSQIF